MVQVLVCILISTGAARSLVQSGRIALERGRFYLPFTGGGRNHHNAKEYAV